MYCTSSRRGSISFWCVTPFTVTLIVFFMAPPLPAARELLVAGHIKWFGWELPPWGFCLGETCWNGPISNLKF
jgi:hypothetical protein